MDAPLTSEAVRRTEQHIETIRAAGDGILADVLTTLLRNYERGSAAFALCGRLALRVEELETEKDNTDTKLAALLERVERLETPPDFMEGVPTVDEPGGEYVPPQDPWQDWPRVRRA